MTHLLQVEKIASVIRKLPYTQFQDENFTSLKREIDEISAGNFKNFTWFFFFFSKIV